MKTLQLILFTFIITNAQASPSCLRGLRELFTTKVHSQTFSQAVKLQPGHKYNVFHRGAQRVYKDLFFSNPRWCSDLL